MSAQEEKPLNRVLLGPPAGRAYTNTFSEKKPISAFYTFLNPYIGDLPETLMADVLKKAVHWFCSESQVLEDMTEIFLQDGVYDYALPVPKDQFLVSINIDAIKRWYALRGGDAWGGFFGWGSYVSGDDVWPLVRRRGGYWVIELRGDSFWEQPLKVPYSWTPWQDACEVPLELYERWNRPIVSKAASLLYQMGGNEWSSENKAAVREKEAETWLAKARTKRANEYSTAKTRIKHPPFLGRGRGGFGGCGGWRF